ncbi:MAG: ATP-binding protein [Candidatus Promineifilaceae bacterium]
MAPDQESPTGPITFLFTDIEGSTQLWERHGEAMRPALARHDALLRETVEVHNGHVVKTTGDGLLAVFSSVNDALRAALAAQHALKDEPWPSIAPDSVRVRMGLHRGEAQLRDGDYYGTAVNQAARIMDLAHGRQIVLSGSVADLAAAALSPDLSLRDLGRHPLRGLREDVHILQLNAPGLPHNFPPLRSGATLTGNLPAHTSSFVGRGREMAELRAMLPETRLLTLTGPGGTGKSRLSLQIAADVQHAYEHGAWLVELAPVADPDRVMDTVATTFDLHGQSLEQTQNMLFDYLQEKELLLILDNCEHLISATAQLAADLIAACPELTILASSREGLGVYGETTYHLPTLSLPEDNVRGAEDVGQSEAALLFVERARAVLPHFALTDANAPAVAQVVRRLDGIPLAIELAAARLNVFNVEQIAGRLDDRFRLLTGGSRTALPRQQTLRALIDWSYDLLDEEERTLFRYLSVFVGGWTFDAAEYVADPLDVLTILPQLVSKSLVLREAAPDDSGVEQEPRYYYLETIRQYARDRLVEAGEVQEARDRHFAFLEQLAHSGNFGASLGTTRTARIIFEHDNLRAAMEWGIELYPERVLNLIWQLAFFLADQLSGVGYIEYTVAALEQLDNLPAATAEIEQRRERARRRGLVALSMLKMFLGHIQEAHQIAADVSETLRQTSSEPYLLATALFVQAQSSFFLEDPSLEPLANQAVAILRQMDDTLPSRSLLNMALMLAAEGANRRGDRELAERYFIEVRDSMESADPEILPWAEFSLLVMMMHIGLEPERLRAQQEKAVAALRAGSSRRMAAMAESDWAHRLRKDGKLDEALDIYRRMLVEWRELGHRAAMANILENMAFIDRARGHFLRAAILFGAAEQIREVIGQDMLPAERGEYDREVAALKSALAAAEVERFWKRGRSLSTDALIAMALNGAHDGD